MGVSLDAVQARQLAAFAQLLRRWNAVHNLTSADADDQLLSVHLLDSLSIVPAIASISGDQALRCLDVGAGGGLPGIPLAVACPRLQVTLIDKVQKKVAFMTQARVELALDNVDCVHARVEDLKRPPFPLIIARAFASLADLVRKTRHLLSPGGRWLAMKGEPPLGELADLARAAPEVRVEHVVKLRVPRLDAERHLVILQSP